MDYDCCFTSSLRQSGRVPKADGLGFQVGSSYDTDFNFDYHVSFTPEELAKKQAFFNFTTEDPHVSEREGVSVFLRPFRSCVSHIFSICSWHHMLNVAYHYLDLVPKGRDEAGHDFPQFWVRRHDEYGKS